VSLRDDVVRMLTRDADDRGGLMFDDLATQRLVERVNALDDAALLDASHELVRLAHFLDVMRQSPAAAGTLVTLLVALSDRLLAAHGEQVRVVTDAAQRKLAAFRGDARVTSALASASGARPEGTIAAGPTARFEAGKKR
jgi:hypothetical protein